MADYTIDVDVKVDESELNSLETKIDSLKKEPVKIDIIPNFKDIKSASKNIKLAVEEAQKDLTKRQSKQKTSLIKNMFDPGTIDMKEINIALENVRKIIGNNLDLGSVKLSVNDSIMTDLNGLENKLKDIKHLAQSMGSIKLNVSDNINTANNEVVVGNGSKSKEKTLPFSQYMSLLKSNMKNESSLRKDLKSEKISYKDAKGDIARIIKDQKAIQAEIEKRFGSSGRFIADQYIEQARAKADQDLKNVKKIEKIEQTNNLFDKEYKKIIQKQKDYEQFYKDAGNKGTPLDQKLHQGYSDRLAEHEKVLKNISALNAEMQTYTDAERIRSANTEMEAYVKEAKRQEKILDNISQFTAITDTKYNKQRYIGLDKNLTDSDITKNMDSMVKEFAKGSKYTQEYNAETGKMIATIDRGSGAIEKYTLKYSQNTGAIDGSLSKVSQQVKPLSSYVSELGEKFKNLSQYLISNFGFEALQTGITSGIASIKDLDTAMTELKKTSEGTKQQYSDFTKQANKDAKEVGSTTTQLTNSAADWSRLGYSLNESSQLARTTSILKNVSEFEDINDASTALISMMKAFDVKANDSMKLVDKMNLIGNNYAISTDGIATALQASGSALVAAGNDFDKSVALVTAANSVVQDPSQVGKILCPYIQ